jgi:hypothetical protein
VEEEQQIRAMCHQPEYASLPPSQIVPRLTESGELAAALMQRTVLRERCYRQPLVLHADNGAAMKSQTLQIKLAMAE